MTLHYEFPLITNLYDVLPAIKDEPAFVVIDKGDYIVIDYVYQSEEVFPPATDRYSMIRRECRGLIFDGKTKALVSRPYHKFFNYGEREDTSLIDLARQHLVLTKLDGSMIRPLKVGGGWRLATRKGVTDTAMQAETFVAGRSQYKRLFDRCEERQVTPIFEWCSPKNRIVVEYTESSLVLCAARETLSGRYLSHDELRALARDTYRDIPVVQQHGVTGSMQRFVREHKDREGIEGFVVRFADGHMIKVKTDWYVKIHRAKDVLSSERGVLELWLENKLDDLFATLPKEDIKRVQQYIYDVLADINVMHSQVVKTRDFWHMTGDRKHFALVAKVDPIIRTLVFACWDDSTLAYDAILDYVRKHAVSNQQFAKLKATVLKTATLKQPQESVNAEVSL